MWAVCGFMWNNSEINWTLKCRTEDYFVSFELKVLKKPQACPAHSKHQIYNKIKLKKECEDLKFENLSQIQTTFEIET